jgi:nitrite reductase/ring-hydroxylating ferredoxin subunit
MPVRSTTMSLHRVARVADVPEDRGLQVEIGERKIVLLRANGQLRAFQGECPHAGAPLADGALCNGRLICPWHKAAFRVEDGALCEPPALDSLKRYPLELRGDEVWVDDQPLPDGHTPPADDSRTFVIVGAGAAGTACGGTAGERFRWPDHHARPRSGSRLRPHGAEQICPRRRNVGAGNPPLRDEDFYKSSASNADKAKSPPSTQQRKPCI